MSAISGSNYKIFLGHLTQVAVESHLSPPPVEMGDYLDDEIPLVTVISEIEGLKIGLLLAFEAASRTHMNELSTQLLKRWISHITDQAHQQFTSFLMAERYRRIDDVEDPLAIEISEKLDRIAETIVVPQNFTTQEKCLSEVYDTSFSLMTKEIVTRRFRPEDKGIPSFINFELYCFNSHIVPMYDPCTSYLMAKYAARVEVIAFKKKIRSTVTGHDVLKRLKRFAEAKVLDLTGCVFVNQVAFCERHFKLQKIILTGTPVHPVDIPLPNKNFPQLVSVIQERHLTVFDFEREYNQPLDQVVEKLQKSDTILSARFSEQFCSKISCTQENIENIIKIYDLLHDKLLLGDYLDFVAHFHKLIIYLFESKASFLFKPIAQGYPLLEFINKLRSCPKYPAEYRDELDRLIYNFLALRNDDDVVTSIIYCDRVRHVALYIKLHPEEIKRILAELKRQFVLYDNMLFICDDEQYAEKFIKRIGLILDLYLCLSHKNLDGNEALLSDIQNPTTALRRINSKVIKAGPYYSRITQLLIAYALVIPMKKSWVREDTLENILASYNNYEFRGLPFLILGVGTAECVEGLDRYSILGSSIKIYRGVVFGSFSIHYKALTWKTLMQGHLGGITKELVDALVLAAIKFPDYKENIIHRLGELGRGNHKDEKHQIQVNHYALEKLTLLATG